MMEYENNSATQMAEDELWELEYNYDDVPAKEYIEKLDNFNTFREYIYIYAKRNGFAGDESDVDSLAKFVVNLSVKANAILELPTMRNWLKKTRPSGNEDGREKVYRLCFAFGMNATQTKEFFLKAYLERPFNYKEINEAVYFFCMNNGKGYADAVRIIAMVKDAIEKSKTDNSYENPDAVSVTEQIGNDIYEMTTEEDVIKYLVENSPGFGEKNKSAKAKIQKFFEECKELAEKEYQFFYEDKITVKNIDELLNRITGYAARETENGEKVYKKSISSRESKLPTLVKRNFPQREQFKQIEKGDPSSDVVRKFLILLNFYHFYADAFVKDKKALENGMYYEFIDDINGTLAECGYVQLYLRNPYDWIFLYCAALAKNPIDEFRSIIREFYLDVEEIYEE